MYKMNLIFKLSTLLLVSTTTVTYTTASGFGVGSKRPRSHATDLVDHEAFPRVDSSAIPMEVQRDAKIARTDTETGPAGDITGGAAGGAGAIPRTDYKSLLDIIKDLRHGDPARQEEARNLCASHADKILSLGSLEQQNDFFRSYGKVLYRLNRMHEAVEILNDFYKTGVMDEYTKVIYADTLEYTGRVDGAITLYQYVANKRDCKESIRAQAHIGLGNAHQGEEHYRDALRLLGNHGDVRLRAQARIGLGNAAGAARQSIKCIPIIILHLSNVDLMSQK
jgi:hypothetical protein